MNYWPAEVTNLSELHLPLLSFLNGLSKNEAAVVKEFYNMHGRVAGLKARGGFEVTMEWKDRQLVTAMIKSNNGGLCKLRTSQPVKINGFQTVSKQTNLGYITSFTAQKGVKYNVSRL